ncbi:MAG TPA: hypothetical protein VE913_08920, partial [Longimicrobium sp.]|nr:hypothetical protein [Longimicrobium sp.]
MAHLPLPGSIRSSSMRSMLFTRFLPLVAVLAAMPLAAQAPDPMELNRAGRWAEAAEAARGIIAKPAATPTGHCEA